MITALVASLVIGGTAHFLALFLTAISGMLIPEEYLINPIVDFGLYHLVALYISIFGWYLMGTFEGMRNRWMLATLVYMILFHFAVWFILQEYAPALYRAGLNCLDAPSVRSLIECFTAGKDHHLFVDPCNQMCTPGL
ncbi:MAG: hypothetical protein N2691_04580 [Patescibacteria group bacterium]|nr:hypothetical protein [Patescibacteria group bacterium]